MVFVQQYSEKNLGQLYSSLLLLIKNYRDSKNTIKIKKLFQNFTQISFLFFILVNLT